MAMMGLGALVSAAHAEDMAARAPVVVELFTSEGCSSCPPADAFLGELAQRPDILALAFHIDYWDSIGWKDPFASPAATQRQRDYAGSLALNSVYTPQMVIDGAADAVGSDRGSVARAIKAAQQRGKIPLAITADAAGSWHVAIPDGDAAHLAPVTVWLVRYDRRQATPVTRGENAGSTLIEYNIVRDFHPIGRWAGARLDLPLDIGPAPSDNGGVAVLLQAGTSGPIIGAAALPATATGGS
jgi:hypothetical protein